jgi:hypothetical protein
VPTVVPPPILPKPTPIEVPPLGLPAVGDGTVFQSGTVVSQPLRPVEPAEPKETVAEKAPPTEAEMAAAEVVRPVPSWTTLEYLLWWPKAQPVPPLVTTGRGPALGGPNTLVLVGGAAVDSPDVSGARFSVGWSGNDAETAGLGVTYLFLGTRTARTAVSEPAFGRGRFLARPITNAVTGTPDAIPVAIPGGLGGHVEATTTTRLTGWEINGVANLLACPQFRVNALAGYRYFMVNEGLRVDQTALFPQTASSVPVLASLSDQIDAHNRFHGGQLGLMTDFTRGPVFVEATAKVGLGQATTVVQVSGQSVAVGPGFPPAVQFYGGGVLGQPTNSGRFVRSVFAVLPEAAVKVGYRFRDRSRFYVGYNFLYLSEAVRAGDQVDEVVDPAQVPLFGRPTAAVVERPIPVLERSDFWVQGLVFGVEYRY